MKEIHIGTYGQTFVFEEYDEAIAELIAEHLYDIKFTGFCEYYSGKVLFGGRYGVGLLLRFEKTNKTPDYPFWKAFKEKVIKNLLFAHMEAADKRAMKDTLLFHGTFHFENGILKESAGDSFEHSAFYEALKKE